MARIDQDRRRERIGSAIAVAALHSALGYLLLAGFGVTILPAPERALKVFAIAPAPPPPPAMEEKPGEGPRARGRIIAGEPQGPPLAGPGGGAPGSASSRRR